VMLWISQFKVLFRRGTRVKGCAFDELGDYFKA